MIATIVEWYVAATYEIIMGQMAFFVIIVYWAWKEKGRTHFFTELIMFFTAIFAFLVREQWAFSLLSLSIWAHIFLIASEVLRGED